MYLYCGEMMALSEPPQVYAKAVLVNPTDEHEPVSLLSAEQVKRNADGSPDRAGRRRRPDAEHCTECVCYASSARKTRQNLRISVRGTWFCNGMIRFWNPIRHRRAMDKVVLLPSEGRYVRHRH